MVTTKKQVVLNETQHSVVVIVDYQDWQKTQASLQQLDLGAGTDEATDTSKASMAFAAEAFSLSVDPLEDQRRVRSEQSKIEIQPQDIATFMVKY